MSASTPTIDAEQLDRLYTQLAEALGRVGEARASLFLATLVLDLLAAGVDPSRVPEAIARSESLASK